ncbi:MAG: dimethylarginine dimethylaminohydrolase family protein [Candidatus Kariarchaeaceae archaeon]
MKALVREPGDNYCKCVSSHPEKKLLKLSLAREQHAAYCSTLRELGVKVINLPREDLHPDSCFVEDTAVIYKGKAMITRMGIESRRGEEKAIEEYLKKSMPTKRIEEPGTLEGGDIIHLPELLISGVTQRTNLEGVNQLSDWLEIPVLTCQDQNIVHLKSYATYLGKEFMVITEKYYNHPVFDEFNKIMVPEKEKYAANTLTIGETVIMPEGYEFTKQKIKEEGFEVITLEMSEFERCEGALSCLSLIIG